jgi:hypothetical protein
LASVAVLSLVLPVAGQADSSLFCTADAPVFGHRHVEVSGGGAIHASDGNLVRVRSNHKIVLSGGSTLEGDAISGGEIKLSGGSQVSGLIVEDHPTPVVLEEVHDLVAVYEYDNDNASIPLTGEGEVAVEGTELEVKGGDSLAMAAGDYYFTEFKFSGGSTLHLTGDVRIYMPDGKFEFSGGGLASTGESSTLMVVMADRGEVKTSGGSNFHGAIYAPHAKAEVSGDGNSYGSVIAREFKLTGGSELYPRDVCVLGPPVIDPNPEWEDWD